MTLESHWNGLFDVIYQLFDCFLELVSFPVCLSFYDTRIALTLHIRLNLSDCLFRLGIFGYLTPFVLFRLFFDYLTVFWRLSDCLSAI